MVAATRLRHLLDRYRPGNLLPYLAYTPDEGLFLMDGDPDSHPAFLGACYMGRPVPGVDEGMVDRLESTLGTYLPAGSMVQVAMAGMRYVDMDVQAYLANRLPYGPAAEAARQRAAFLLSGMESPLVSSSGSLLHIRRVLVSIKIPCTTAPPSDKEISEIAELVDRFHQSLLSVGLSLARLGALGFLRVLRRLTHPTVKTVDDGWSDRQLLRDQVFALDDDIEVGARGKLRLGTAHAQVLGVKRYPERTSLTRMVDLLGDRQGLSNQIRCPFLISLNLQYPDQKGTAAMVQRKSTAINAQAFGPTMKWIPSLRYKKYGVDVLVHAMEQGTTLVRSCLTVVLFDEDPRDLARQSAGLKTHWQSLGYTMDDECHIHYAQFLNALPLFPSPESVLNTYRYQTMGAIHATQMLPILGDLTSTGPGAASLFVTRRMEPFLLDLYDSATNYNAIVFAESGAGKSVLAQRLALDYLSRGARVWIIDVGRSYHKLAAVLDGEFMQFSEASQVCLNPFTNISDIAEEADLLKAQLELMSGHRDGLTDYALARLEEAIYAVWGRLGPSMTVTDVADWLQQQPDDRVRDVGKMLYPFCRHGSLGRWFDGPANVDFRKDLVVLELEELKSKPGLQKVILLQLISRIQHEMFLHQQDNRPKILIVDEAWDLLDDPAIGHFFEHAYRRFRKYRGSAIVVTQSVADLYNSRSGRAIAANSAFRLILRQTDESIEAARDAKQLLLDDAGFHALKTVHTAGGQYSELMISIGRFWEIVRLVEDPFSLLLMSTTGRARSEVLAAIDRGEDVTQTIHRLLAEGVHG